MKMILERCCTSCGQVREAAQCGAARVELCENLKVGGVTPSHTLISECTAVGIPVNVLVRPRAGSFVYTPEEVALMLEDISECARLGASAAVVGALNADGSIDCELSRLLCEQAHCSGLKATFHRAFDECTEDPFDAMEKIIEAGYDRILTSGRKPAAPQGAPLIAELVKRSAGRIIIMPGSGVTPENIVALQQETLAEEFHGTRLCSRQTVSE